MHKVLGTAALTTVICWLAAPALAASGASIAVSPHTQHAGGSVQVSGTCEAGTSGFAISRAFLHDTTHDFAGVGAAPFTTDSQGRFAFPKLRSARYNIKVHHHGYADFYHVRVTTEHAAPELVLRLKPYVH